MSENREEVPRVVGGRPHPEDRAPQPGEIASSEFEWGPHALFLRIGSLSVELAGLDDELAAMVRRNYDGFLAGAGDEPTVSARTQPAGVRFVRSMQERYLYLPRAEGKSEEARLDARFDASGVELWSYFFAGGFDREARQGRLVLCDCPPADREQAVENFLRFFVSTLALRHGGFLLHASGVVKDGRSVLFFGPSGAGKSTTAANSPGTERLGDDLVLVEPWRGSAFRACGVPFRGSFAGDERNSSACAPLAMACRLVQADEILLEDTSKPVQAAELVSQLPFLLDDAPLRALAMERVRAFIDAVRVKRLHLRNDASFWTLLDAELA